MVQILLRYSELLQEDFQGSSCAGKMKQLASQMCRGALWRKELLTINTLEGQIDLLHRVRDGAFVQSGSRCEDEGPELEVSSCDQFAGV
jgi:hypothetical protein